MELFPKQYPRKLNILGVPWRVRYFSKRKDIDVSERYTGLSNSDTAEIHILTNTRPPNMIIETIMHEVCHVLVMTTQLDKIRLTESFVSILSVVISDFLFSNKLFKSNNTGYKKSMDEQTVHTPVEKAKWRSELVPRIGYGTEILNVYTVKSV